MKELYASGRYLFALAVIAFGIIQLVTGQFLSSLLPIDPTLPAKTFLLYMISTVFVVGGLGLIPAANARRMALLLGLFFFGLFIYPHIVRFATGHVTDPGEWTVAFETLAFCGGALIIAADNSKPDEPRFPKLLREGNFLFAISLLVFGIQHFLYARYIATLIPSWIPFPLFWAWFVGVAFVVSCFCFLINRRTRFIASFMGIMFLVWVVILHGVRVIKTPGEEKEWTSLFIALGFAGIFFAIARKPDRKGL